MFNLRLALRTLFKTPFVTIVAALSLALGIGANTAIFSIFDLMLRRPLPVSHPEELVNLGAPGPKPGSQSCSQAGSCELVFSYLMFRDLQKAQSSPFTAIAAHRNFGSNISIRDLSINAAGMLVSGTYFPALGVQPRLGRLFTRADDETLGGHYVAVLGHDFWESRLGADPDIVNKTMLVNGKQMTIVGVAPKGFDATVLGTKPFFYVPLAMATEMGVWNKRGVDSRRSYWLYLFARLKPDVTMDQAKTAINATYRPIINDVEAPLQDGMSDQTMKRFRAKEITVEDGRRGQSSVYREASTPLILLFSITGIVLLIACANIANLLLARAANREMEMAVRLSLGATRRQLLAQLLTESVVLALLGGILSLAFAQWTLAGITGLLPSDITTALPFRMSWMAVGFAGATSLVTGLAFGLFPAIHSTRPDLVTAMRNNSGKLSGGRTASRFRTSLATAQVALSMALLMSAGLFVKSLWNVSRVNLGVQIDNVLTFSVSPSRSGYDSTRSKVLYARLEDELASIPGVTGVTSSMVPLLGGSNWGSDVQVQGFKEDADTDDNARFNEVGPGYFRTLGVQLLAGREFTPADERGRPEVVVVNETFAKKFGLGRDVVGKRMGWADTSNLHMEIVGLVRDSKYSGVKDTTPALFFLPHRQDANVGSMNFYVKTSGDPSQSLRAIPGVVRRLDASLPVEELRTMPQQVRENVFMDRMISTLSASFALLATLLAAIGLYGVLAYSVAQRTREIGVRMALGADSGAVRRMILGQVGIMVLIGGIIGIGGAIALGRGAKSLLFELSGTDPVVMAVSVVVLTVVAMGAGYIPALRASKVDPMQALRYE
jgi:predicted permease